MNEEKNVTNIHNEVFELDGKTEEHTKHTHEHEHSHSHSQKSDVMHRLSTIVGHVNGIKQMVKDDVDCSDVLVQIAAVKASFAAVGRIILKDHMEHCIVEAVEHNDQEAISRFSRALDKFIT